MWAYTLFLEGSGMNCPQCQAPNAQDSAFCGNCGTRLAPAPAPAGGYPPPGQGAPAGQYPPPGQYSPPDQYQPAGEYQPGQYLPADQYQPWGQQPPTGYPQDGQYQPRPSGPVAQFHFDLKRLTRADQVIAIATLVTMISIFFTWVSGSITESTGSVSQTQTVGSESGTSEHGWLWLVFVLGLLLIAYLVMRAGWDEPPVKLPVAHVPLLLVGTGVQLLLVLIAFFVTPTAPSAAQLQAVGVTGTASVNWDFGAYLGLLAAIVAAVPVAVPAIQSIVAGNRR
jgi:hypothetical protein